jgi:hypothetical protein
MRDCKTNAEINQDAWETLNSAVSRPFDKLIESVLMRIPLPVFYLAEDDQGRMIVVDGLQRLKPLSRCTAPFGWQRNIPMPVYY